TPWPLTVATWMRQAASRTATSTRPSRSWIWVRRICPSSPALPSLTPWRLTLSSPALPRSLGISRKPAAACSRRRGWSGSSRRQTEVKLGRKTAASWSPRPRQTQPPSLAMPSPRPPRRGSAARVGTRARQRGQRRR
ncbi:hypothetical protein H4R21_001181, partial [Coemansia helicoidea]